jgi:hypothetical protein
MHPETLKAFPEGWFPAGVATRTDVAAGSGAGRGGQIAPQRGQKKLWRPRHPTAIMNANRSGKKRNQLSPLPIDPRASRQSAFIRDPFFVSVRSLKTQSPAINRQDRGARPSSTNSVASEPLCRLKNCT